MTGVGDGVEMVVDIGGSCSFETLAGVKLGVGVELGVASLTGVIDGFS